MDDLVGEARHLSPSAQEALRLRAVAALVGCRDREEVAALFGVSLKAVEKRWRSGWRVAGVRCWPGRVDVASGSVRCCLRPGGRPGGRLSSITCRATWGSWGRCGRGARSAR
ncbi:hypothetical protein [Streptomyces sp. H27-C3]|uniref:hypothetical protein n=1 Tax=Streptomyces sp. H27-C3 TaxID=3046305 RepID=UPI0024B94200|nr:hypothetical protein [Streptomyces sp. H27-C3]MDJ0466668.1 hypothetical protein [Streptomyces sp. H27-C3]